MKKPDPIALIMSLLMVSMIAMSFSSEGISLTCSKTGYVYDGARCIDPWIDSQVEEHLQENGDTVAAKLAAQVGVPEWRVFVAEDRSEKISCYKIRPAGFMSSPIYECTYTGGGAR